MDNKKLVSVLMSAYNSEDSISNAIESIVNQEYSEIELLIMDDGSSDNTTEICKEFSQKFNNISSTHDNLRSEFKQFSYFNLLTN